METDPVSKTLCSLVFLNTRQWTKSKNPVILRIEHQTMDQVQKPSNSAAAAAAANGGGDDDDDDACLQAVESFYIPPD
jgi:hypothetical protein